MGMISARQILLILTGIIAIGVLYSYIPYQKKIPDNDNIAEPNGEYRKNRPLECKDLVSFSKLNNDFSASTYVAIAKCYRMTNQLDLAMKIIGLAKKRESSIAEVYCELGEIYLKMGKLVESYKAFAACASLVDLKKSEIESRLKEIAGQIK